MDFNLDFSQQCSQFSAYNKVLHYPKSWIPGIHVCLCMCVFSALTFETYPPLRCHGYRSFKSPFSRSVPSWNKQKIGALGNASCWNLCKLWHNMNIQHWNKNDNVVLNTHDIAWNIKNTKPYTIKQTHCKEHTGTGAFPIPFSYLCAWYFFFLLQPFHTDYNLFKLSTELNPRLINLLQLV